MVGDNLEQNEVAGAVYRFGAYFTLNFKRLRKG